MAVLRQENWLGQQRVDVPMLRAVESAVAADFDTVAGRILTGQQPLVVRGFLLANFGAGTTVTAVQLAVADSILCNLNASQSGTFLWVPANRAVEVLDPSLNPRVTGSWTAGQTNFVGLDLTRDADASTSDLVEFKNPNTNLEVAKEVPLARVMDYRIVITTTPFSAQPNLVPIAKVITNGTNQVVSVTDARNMLFRLATGGDNPTNTVSYSWPQGRAQSVLLNSFTGGDRTIASMRDLVQALESRIWEIGGGEDWYSPTADRNVFMANTGTTAPLADYFTWDGTNLLWIGLSFLFDNANYAGVFFNTVNDQTSNSPGLTNLADGDCIYVDLDRTTNATLTAVKAPYQSLGTPTIPGSRQVIAVRHGAFVLTRGDRNPVGVPVPPATTTTLGIVKLGQTSETPLSPVVPNFGSGHSISWIATSATPGLNVFSNTAVTGIGVAGLMFGSTVTGGVIAGVAGFGGSGHPGIYGEGQSGNTDGVQGVGSGTSSGIHGTGGTNGPGGLFAAGGGNNPGVNSTGAGTGPGLAATGGTTGAGAALTPGASANVAARFLGSPYITWDGNPASTTISDGTPWYRAMASAQIAIAYGYYTVAAGILTSHKVWNNPAISGNLTSGSAVTFSLGGSLPDNNFVVVAYWSTGAPAATGMEVINRTTAGGVGGAASFQISNSSGSDFGGQINFVIFYHA